MFYLIPIPWGLWHGNLIPVQLLTVRRLTAGTNHPSQIVETPKKNKDLPFSAVQYQGIMDSHSGYNSGLDIKSDECSIKKLSNILDCEKCINMV